MAKIKINANHIVGKIKPMHAGGQPPVTSNADDCFFHYLTEAGIPYSRLHDVGGAFGGGKYVDVPNIFRDFDADETDPNNYDFTFTDLLLAQLNKAKVEPYFRLGVTIECAGHIKPYWVHCPKDKDKWARICERIVAHYTKGWANGFHYQITYWEIWGEPDNTPWLWTGTPQEYYELYCKTATLIKKHHPDVKVGAYGCSGFENAWKGEDAVSPLVAYRIQFFRDFLAYVKAQNAPFDFFSWHCYGNTETIVKEAAWVKNELVRLGYPDAESHLNEWDPYAEELGTAHHSAEIAAAMLAMQKGSVDVCCIYDMRTSSAPYCPLFNPITHKPIHGYYSMVAFNELYKLGSEIKCDCDEETLYAVAATDGKRFALVLSNLTGKKQTLEILGADLANARYHVIDQERLLSWSTPVNYIENNQVLLIEW